MGDVADDVISEEHFSEEKKRKKKKKDVQYIDEIIAKELERKIKRK